MNRMPLSLIALSYSILAILYALLIPPWEAPDEPAHYTYVAQLASRGRPPIDPSIRQTDSFAKDYAYVSSNYEWYQPALGYLPDALVYRTLAVLAPGSLPLDIPPLNPLFSTNPSKYANLFSHPRLVPFQIWNEGWGLVVIRIFSSLWGLGVIYAAHKIGSLLQPEDATLGIVAAGCVAFLPQFTFINASIRSDTVTNAIAALVLLCAAYLQTKNAGADRLAILLGVLLGLGLLSKTTFVYMLPVALLAIILRAPLSPRAWAKPLALLLAPVIILVSAYFLIFPEARAALAYTYNTTLAINPKLLTWGNLKQIPAPLLIDLFYARFGWANVAPADFWSRLAFSIWAIGGGATLLYALRQIRKPGMGHTLKILAILGSALLLAVTGVVRFNLSVFQPQGRLLFPALAAWSLLGFWGFWQVLSPRGRAALSIGAIAFMLVFNASSLLALVSAYY